MKLKLQQIKSLTVDDVLYAFQGEAGMSLFCGGGEQFVNIQYLNTELHDCDFCDYDEDNGNIAEILAVIKENIGKLRCYKSSPELIGLTLGREQYMIQLLKPCI